MSKYGVFSGPYFPAFRLNTERYGVSLLIQSVCGKIRTRKNFGFEHFSHSVSNKTLMIVDIDIFLHASHLRSRERSTLHHFSPDSLVHWSLNYADKAILFKDCRDLGVVVVVVWINLIGWIFEKGEKIVGMVV